MQHFKLFKFKDIQWLLFKKICNENDKLYALSIYEIPFLVWGIFPI